MNSIYYAKLKIDYKKKHSRNILICVKTYGIDINDAKNNLANLVNNWQDIKSYEVLKIGTYPFQISRYYVSGAIKLSSGKSKEIKLTILAENEPEAHQIFKEITNPWKGIVSTEITKTEIHF